MREFPFPVGARGVIPAEFDVLRATEPVAAARLADGMVVHLVTRYPDVVTVLSDHRFSRARAAELPGIGFGRAQRTGVLDLDPPEHATLRSPLDRALSEERVRQWQPTLAKAAREQLAAFMAHPRPADFVREFTRPFAARTICELTGLDAAAAAGIADRIDTFLGGDNPAARSAAAAGVHAALDQLIRDRRARPADDITSILLDEAAAAPGLTGSDAHTVLFGLLISGYVGNRNALARHVFALISEADPGATLASVITDADTVVDELLRRYPSGNDGLLRVVTEPVELSGTLLPAGAVVMPLIGAANHDPEVFDDPGVLCPKRGQNPHLSFGRGTHACPGDHLARAIMRTVLGEIAVTLPGLGLAIPPDDVRHTSDLLPLGIESLPVTW